MTEFEQHNRDRAIAVLLDLAENEEGDPYVRGEAAGVVLTDAQEHRRLDEEVQLRELQERLDELEEKAEKRTGVKP